MRPLPIESSASAGWLLWGWSLRIIKWVAGWINGLEDEMRLGLSLACLAIMAGCTDKHPCRGHLVVDASWRANEDDRADRNRRESTPVPTPDIQREKGERNEVTPIDPVAKTEPIRPAQAANPKSPLLYRHCSNKLMSCVRLAT